MEEIAFGDWPGQGMEHLAGSNPWLPAYGFQPPQTLQFDKDDFLGNPDADLFLHGGSSNASYVYLETIQEETSDDLRSESDLSESHVGWLATDSDSGSVIRIQGLDDGDCESDREVACPAKRRRQDYNNLIIISDDDSTHSLSRSSSLIQFESLEKQCQDISSSSPSIFSSFSYDSLERTTTANHKPGNVSPDSLEHDDAPASDDDDDDDDDEESSYYKTLKIDVPTKRVQNQTSLSSSSSSSASSSADSEETQTWRSFDALQSNITPRQRTVKVSAENLSEDSGYSDHFMQQRCSSIPNMIVHAEKERNLYKTRVEIRNSGSKSFDAYDGDVIYTFGNQTKSHFGVSYHDLSVVDRRPLIDRFMQLKRLNGSNATVECCDDAITASSGSSVAKNTDNVSSSEPNLLNAVCGGSQPDVLRTSVPNDLNLTAASLNNETSSVATQNCDLSNSNSVAMPKKLSRYHRAEYGDKITIRLKYDSSDSSDVETAPTSACFKREGSYMEAMAHSYDLKAISEHSIVDVDGGSKNSHHGTGLPMRSVISTPNIYCNNEEDEEKEDEDEDEENLLLQSGSKSLSGSSKGVHFSEVVSEVINWPDAVSTSSNYTPSLDSSSSSSSPERVPPILLSQSQPELFGRRYMHDEDAAVKMRRCMLNKRCDDVKSLCVVEPSETTATTTTATPDVCYPTHMHGHVLNKQQQEEQRSTAVVKVAGSKPAQAAMDTKPAVVVGKKSGATTRLGGFFSRIASFRFSSSSSAKQKQAAKNNNKCGAQSVNNVVVATNTGQRLATKDDYIYIPLKGPSTTEVDGSCGGGIGKVQVDGNVAPKIQKCSAKPPLPKLPPRVVGASVKRRPPDEANAAAISEQQRRRCCIDSPSSQTHSSSTGLPRLPMEEPPMGLIETDLDTEVTVITSHTNCVGSHAAKTRSLMNLGAEAPPTIACCLPPAAQPGAASSHHHHHHHRSARPHKSMEFLLDKQNLKVVEPPENELQKGGVERVMSEHQLRVQRSLQKLNVPDWYKQNQIPSEGFLLNSKHNTSRECRWQGTGSKTTSLSSLGGSQTHSPIILSPTLHQQPFVRWSTSKLNSTASSPCASTRSSFNARCQPNGSISPSSLRGSFNYRQPYLGWRSQERLARPRTPAERLANTLLNQPAPSQPHESPEIQTSIKEVTSAIVHYVSGLRPDNNGVGLMGHEAQSPRGSHQRLCWLESSFVGSRPLDSPQTPLTLTESTTTPINVPPPSSLRLDLQTHNDVSMLNTLAGSRKPSPSSTTLEDVLDSLLGLPSSTRAPSPSLQGTASANTSPVRRQGDHSRVSEQFRRRSEGSEPTSRPPSAGNHSGSPLLRCRYSRCGRSATARTTEALQFKNCHNCSYTYCSRSCRRAHWEKHRKTCLFSRVGTLCRQVIAASKEQEDTLHTLSVIARRGFLSHGLGAVKIFFPCPEAAESFLDKGLESLGEPTYVPWPDLLPTEMGQQLYAELVKMCKSYNPDAKLVLYVSVCVVSEAPAAGAAKWERQLVSRCGKLKLDKNLQIQSNIVNEMDNPETLILTSPPITVQHLREISFANIQRHLRQRGVSLKRHYPDIYQQLCSYVDGTCSKFTPVTVYPKDSSTGKTFMCIIMPDVEPACVDNVSTAGIRVRTVDVLDSEIVLDRA